MDLILNFPLWFLVALALALLVLLAAVLRGSTARAAPPGEPAPPAGEPPAGVTLRGLSDAVRMQEFPLRSAEVRIGRDSKSNDIVLPYETVSGRHATIVQRDGRFFLRDLHSRNGTYHNGDPITHRDGQAEVELRHGDHVTFDAYEFEFRTRPLSSLVTDEEIRLKQTVLVHRLPE